MSRLIFLVLGTLTMLPSAAGSRSRDERGLSQSTENVILLVGAVTVAAAVILAVKTYIDGKLVLTGP